MAIDDKIMSLVGASRTALGTGGMRSKLQAARMATSAGESVSIASGREPNVLPRLLSGEKLGPLVPATGESLNSWKRWIGYTAKPKGAFVVDAGAHAALAQKGKSLLPVGVIEVRGEFTRRRRRAQHPCGQESAAAPNIPPDSPPRRRPTAQLLNCPRRHDR